jgi:exopolysaccharide production protein ExoY
MGRLVSDQRVCSFPVLADESSSSFATRGYAAKRVIDISVSVLLLVAFLPVLLIIAVAVSLDNGSVFFGHARIGKNYREFKCLKFRTMVADGSVVLTDYFERYPEALEEWRATRKLRYDPRVTWVGNLLRRTSLDELPQLINVLRGDMSLVGPRPIVSDEIHYYGDQFQVYASIRPGLTGAWQTSGRSDTSYQERVALDIDYAQNQSVRRDLLILARTVPAVFLSRGSC